MTGGRRILLRVVPGDVLSDVLNRYGAILGGYAANTGVWRGSCWRFCTPFRSARAPRRQLIMPSADTISGQGGMLTNEARMRKIRPARPFVCPRTPNSDGDPASVFYACECGRRWSHLSREAGAVALEWFWASGLPLEFYRRTNMGVPIALYSHADTN